MEAIRRTLQHGDTLGWGVGDTREQMLCDRSRESERGGTRRDMVVGTWKKERGKARGLGRLIEA